jgi:Tol biopolymer transport system component
VRPLLWLRAFDALEARQLPGTENGDFPFWSPDSRFIAFFADGKLKKIEAAGGPVQTLSDAPAPEGGTWNRDGTILFAATFTAGLSRVSAAGGQVISATTLDASQKEISHRWPEFLPDGRHFLFLAQPANVVSVGSLDSSEIKRLMNTDSKALYAPPGSLVFVRQGTLMSQPFDASRGALTGEAAPIVEQVRNNPGNGRASFSVSTNGVLAYRTSDDLRGSPVWVDRNGRQLTPIVTTPLENAEFPRLSPDGHRLALIVAGDVWVYDLEGRPPIKLTFDGGHYAPLWTPDGQRIVYETNNPAPLRSVQADGSGAGAEVISPQGHYHPHGWSPDGRDLLVVRLDGGVSAPDILKIPIRDKGEPQAVVQTPAAEGQAGTALSADGRWLAYASNVTGQQEIWVRPFPGPGAAVRVSPNGGVEPVWGRGGRELYYLEGNKLMFVALDTRSAFNFKPPSLLFESSYLHGGQPPSYDVAADGRFLMIKSARLQTAAAPVTVVLNWGRR